MAEILKACAGCGRAMNPGAVLYDAEARPVCDACFQQADLLTTDRRAAGNIRKAGYACLAAGAAAIVAPVAHVGFQIACVLAAASSGLYAAQSLGRGNERFTRHLSRRQREIVGACVIAGLALAALSVMGVNLAKLLPA